MPSSLRQSDQFEPLTLVARWTGWLRAAVFAIVAAIVLSARGNPIVGVVELAIAAAAMIGWLASGRLPAPWAQRSLVACLTVITAVGGFAATSHHDTSVLSLAIVSMLAAGVDLPLNAVLVVLFAGVLAVEVGAVSYGDTGLGTVLGYPVLLAGLALVGRYRRAYIVQTAQAQALLAETRRAQAEAQRAAALTERSRIAREIHDVLAHSLSALGIQLQAAEVMLAEHHDVEQTLGALANARRLVDEGLAETRRAVRALRSDAPPLPQALAALLHDRAALTVSGEPYELSPTAGLALLRVAQEAVTNALKHADGNPATIALRYTDTGVELRVENGLPATGNERADIAGASGYGLAGMHERLRLIDGELQAGPIGDRWVVRARVTR